MLINKKNEEAIVNDERMWKGGNATTGVCGCCIFGCWQTAQWLAEGRWQACSTRDRHSSETMNQGQLRTSCKQHVSGHIKGKALHTLLPWQIYSIRHHLNVSMKLLYRLL